MSSVLLPIVTSSLKSVNLRCDFYNTSNMLCQARRPVLVGVAPVLLQSPAPPGGRPAPLLARGFPPIWWLQPTRARTRRDTETQQHGDTWHATTHHLHQLNH